jgi:hypothetical protein
MKQHKLPYPFQLLNDRRLDGFESFLHQNLYYNRGGCQGMIDAAPPHLVVGIIRGALAVERPDLEPMGLNFFSGIASWYFCGKNSFVFSPYVSECLRETDLKNVPTSAVRLPYPVIWMEMPGVYPCLTAQHKPFTKCSEGIKTRGFFVSVDVVPGSGEYYQCIADEPDTREDCLVDGFVDGKLEGGGILSLHIKPMPSLEDRHLLDMGWIRVLLVKDSIGGCIQASKMTLPQYAKSNFDKTTAPYLRAAINAILYLSAPNADLQPVVPSLHGATIFSGKKRRRKAAWAAKARTVMVGYRFTKVKNKDKKASTSESGRRRVRLHRVRGHWRMVVCGEGRAERSPRWIAPHWSGTRREETERAAYVVTGE